VSGLGLAEVVAAFGRSLPGVATPPRAPSSSARKLCAPQARGHLPSERPRPGHGWPWLIRSPDAAIAYAWPRPFFRAQIRSPASSRRQPVRGRADWLPPANRRPPTRSECGLPTPRHPGAVLYALLTSRPPFQEASVLDTLEQVRERDPEPPDRSNCRVGRDLERNRPGGGVRPPARAFFLVFAGLVQTWVMAAGLLGRAGAAEKDRTPQHQGQSFTSRCYGGSRHVHPTADHALCPHPPRRHALATPATGPRRPDGTTRRRPEVGGQPQHHRRVGHQFIGWPDRRGRWRHIRPDGCGRPSVCFDFFPLSAPRRSIMWGSAQVTKRTKRECRRTG
jgi:hypothetical protein